MNSPSAEEAFLRSVYDAFNAAVERREDLEPLIARTYTEDITMEPAEADTWLGGGVIRGHSEMLLFWRTWLAEVSESQFEVLGIRSESQGHDVDVRISGRFKRSGIAFEFDYTHYVEVRDGKVARLRVRRGLGAGCGQEAGVRDATGTAPA